MASNETELLNAVLPWILGIITVIGSVYGSMKLITKYLICRGKKQANDENRIKHIEDEIIEINKKIKDLESIEQARLEKDERTHSDIKEEMYNIGKSLERITGLLEGNGTTR